MRLMALGPGRVQRWTSILAVLNFHVMLLECCPKNIFRAPVVCKLCLVIPEHVLNWACGPGQSERETHELSSQRNVLPNPSKLHLKVKLSPVHEND